MKRLAAHAASLYAEGVPVVLAGDYNVVPTERDIYPTKSYADNALVQPESRAAFRRILDQGWVDAIRTLHPDEPMYTFWDYMRNRWPRDAGLRLDHLLLSADAGEAAGRCGRRSRGAGRGRRERPCAGLGGAEGSREQGSPRLRAKRAKSGQGEQAALRDAPAAGGRWRFLRAPLLSRACRRRSCGAAAGRPAPSSASPTRCCGSIASEKPRAVLVGWDTLSAKTYRNKLYPPYQSGREVRRRAGRAARRAPRVRRGLRLRQRHGRRATRPTIFSPPPSTRTSGAAAPWSSRAATATPSSSPPTSTTILFPVRGGGLRADRPGRSARALRRRAGAGAGLHRPPRRSVRQAAGRAGHGAAGRGQPAAPVRHLGKGAEGRAACRRRPTSFGCIARSRRWTARRRCRSSSRRRRPGTRLRRWRASGSSTSSPTASTRWRGSRPRAIPPPEAWRRGWRSRPGPGCTACPAPRCSKA